MCMEAHQLANQLAYGGEVAAKASKRVREAAAAHAKLLASREMREAIEGNSEAAPQGTATSLEWDETPLQSPEANNVEMNDDSNAFQASNNNINV